MPTTITSAGVTFTDTTTLTSANGVPSALKLTTARTINGIAFDGTADITIPASGSSSAKAWVNFNGTTTSANLAGTYSQSGTTVTITTATAHGLSQGQGIYAFYGTSGTALDGSFVVASITSPTVFTYTATTSLTTSGNVTLNRSSIRSQYNVSSVTKNDIGNYTVNFTTAMSNTNYAVVVGANETNSSTDAGSNHRAWPSSYASSTASASVLFVSYGATFTDADTISIAIFGN